MLGLFIGGYVNPPFVLSHTQGKLMFNWPCMHPQWGCIQRQLWGFLIHIASTIPRQCWSNLLFYLLFIYTYTNSRWYCSYNFVINLHTFQTRLDWKHQVSRYLLSLCGKMFLSYLLSKMKSLVRETFLFNYKREHTISVINYHIIKTNDSLIFYFFIF